MKHEGVTPDGRPEAHCVVVFFLIGLLSAAGPEHVLASRAL